ncbi:MAG: hypothetical protein KDE09_04030, partial [Anaerolineales bacterium]|nr:hypothetical protein [Anaerolineales bacterium]
ATCHMFILAVFITRHMTSIFHVIVIVHMAIIIHMTVFIHVSVACIYLAGSFNDMLVFQGGF